MCTLYSLKYCILGGTVQTFLVPECGSTVLAFGLDLEGLDMTDTFRGVTHRFTVFMKGGGEWKGKII